MAVKSDVRRNLIGSQMTQANVRNLWRPVVPEETAEALQETAGVIAQQHKEQEKLPSNGCLWRRQKCSRRSWSR